MSLLSNIIGFSLFGLAARFGQLGIQKRNLMSNPIGHLIAMGSFGFVGYWAHQWDQRAAVILAEKRAQMMERRSRHVQNTESAGESALAEAS